MGHLVPNEIEDQGLDAHLSIAVTMAHMKLSELDQAVKKGGIKIDGKPIIDGLSLKNGG